MTTTPSNTSLWFRRIGAVALALGIGTFLVVRAQREANPVTPRPSPQAPEAANQVAAPESDPPSSLEAVSDPALLSPTATPDDPAYLLGSKAGVFVETSTGEIPPTPAAEDYLFSSKSLILEPVKPEPKPAPEPVYLPSSKSRAPSGPILAPTPAPAPAKPDGQP